MWVGDTKPGENFITYFYYKSYIRFVAYAFLKHEFQNKDQYFVTPFMKKFCYITKYIQNFKLKRLFIDMLLLVLWHNQGKRPKNTEIPKIKEKKNWKFLQLISELTL